MPERIINYKYGHHVLQARIRFYNVNLLYYVAKCGSKWCKWSKNKVMTVNA